MIQDRRLTILRELRDKWQTRLDRLGQSETPELKAYARAQLAAYDDIINAIIWEYEAVQC